MRKWKFGASLLATALLGFLCGCGGGSGGTSFTAAEITGTAAAGAPLIGSVTIKDSSTPAQTRTVPIAADGTYTVAVSGLRAPFMLRADGYVGANEYHLYSAATRDDIGHTINVTPLTDLIAANVAGSIAKTYFESGNFSSLTASELNFQATLLQARLLPVLKEVGLSDSVDLLRTPFRTDHTGLDAALDVIKVGVDPAAQVATIRNLITQEEMTSYMTQKRYAGALTATTGVATAVTAVQAIAARLQAFSDLCAVSAPSATDTRLMMLFDQVSFREGGRTLTGFLSDITGTPSIVGTKLVNLNLVSLNADQDMADISFTVRQKGTVTGTVVWKAIKKNGVWIFQGDQRVASVGVEARAEYQPLPVSGSSGIYTGIQLLVDDHGSTGIDSAVVTGKGLPASGVTLSRHTGQSWLAVSRSGGNLSVMSDADIAAVADAGEVYTFRLFSGGALQATYQETLKKRPYLSSELRAANFPAFSAQTLADFATYNGGNLGATWTMPSGLSAEYLTVQLNGGRAFVKVQYALQPQATTQVVTISDAVSPSTGRWMSLHARDGYGRSLATVLYD